MMRRDAAHSKVSAGGGWPFEIHEAADAECESCSVDMLDMPPPPRLASEADEPQTVEGRGRGGGRDGRAIWTFLTIDISRFIWSYGSSCQRSGDSVSARVWAGGRCTVAVAECEWRAIGVEGVPVGHSTRRAFGIAARGGRDAPQV